MVLPKIETYPLFRCVSGFIMDWIPYMDTVAKIPKTGVVLVKNLFVAVAFLAFGELANLLLVSLSVCSILGGIVRKWVEYKFLSNQRFWEKQAEAFGSGFEF